MVRLQKYMAECGVASRRACEEFIREGRVTVDGHVAELGCSIEPGSAVVEFDGKRVAREDKVYICLNKPRGIVTTAKDTHNRGTVLDCLEGVDERVFPVGRLDMDVEGVLILTNDGELAYRLTHPKHGIDKVYLAWVEGDLTEESAEIMQQGVELEDGLAAPMSVTVLYQGVGTTLVRIVMQEGRKREVKRLCAAVGHPVRELRRTAIAGIEAQGLEPGEWRYLDEAEVADLRELTGLEE